MKIKLDQIAPHCHSQPILDTWDENEMRSIYCQDCGLKTKSFFSRSMVLKEWFNLNENAKLKQLHQSDSGNAQGKT